MGARLSRIWPIAMILVLALWGVYQCFGNLDGANFSGDEPTYLLAATQYLHGNFSLNQEHPPLAKFIIAFSQVAIGPGEVAARLVTAAFTFAVGWVLLFWLRKEIGLVWAGVAAGTWWVIPRIMPEVGVRIDRFAVLEPYMAGFAVMAVALAWWWFRRGHWWLALAAGVFMAFSVTSKVSSALLVFSFLYLAICRKQLARGIVALALYVVGFGIAFVAIYAPVGMVPAIRYMLTFQAHQRAIGHPVLMDGQVYLRTPWWANLYFTLNGLGPWLLVALLVAMLFAFIPRPSELSVYVGVCVVILLFFYCVIAGNALSYYYYAWIWAMVVLAAIGLSNLWRLVSPFVRRQRRSRPRPWVLARALALGVIAVFLVNGAVTTVDVRHEHPTGFAVAAPLILSKGQSDSWVLNYGYPPWRTDPYLNGKLTYVAPSNPAGFVVPPAAKPWNALAVDRQVGTPPPEITTFLDQNASRLELVMVDSVPLYIPRDGQQIVARGNELVLAPAA